MIPTLEDQLKDLLSSIKLRLRDYKSLNELLADEETNEKMLAEYIRQAVDDFNGIPPILNHAYSWSNMPNRTLFIELIVAITLESVGILDLRNNVTIRDGGVVANPHAKGTTLLQIARTLRAGLDAKITRLKTALNIQGSGDIGNYEQSMGVLVSWINARDLM